MRRFILAVLIGSSAAAFTCTSQAVATSSGGDATAVFNRNLVGHSDFQQSGSTYHVTGQYAGLVAGNSYFTVIYGNANCDPAQAFPVGPFTAGQLGTSSLDTTVVSAVPVRGTRSMSVRMADTSADLDGDGKTGPSDVVAVAGQPQIGLIECDTTPVVS